MSELDLVTHALHFVALCAAGLYVCFLIMLRRALYWKREWIELEHDLARLEGREPRNTREFYRENRKNKKQL